MKWKYAITYGKVKPNWSFEQLEKDMAKYKAEVEKKGFKLVFWGHPYGVSEGMITVLDVEGHMDDYINMGVSVPWNEGRTDFVMVH
jgi:hypothetical protein